jgi:hypothetical protein
MAENISDTLSPKQEGAILALLSEHSVVKASRAGRRRRADHLSWLDEPDFSRAYRKARRESFSQAIALIQRYAGLAAHTLAKVMTDENAPYTAKVQASIAVLRFGREGIELEDLAARVDALERSTLQANRSLPPLN